MKLAKKILKLLNSVRELPCSITDYDFEMLYVKDSCVFETPDQKPLQNSQFWKYPQGQNLQ